MIREARPEDFEQIWLFFRKIAEAGETYTYDRHLSKAEAFRLWMTLPEKTFVYEQYGRIVGTYYLKTNQAGGGSHICNCGYMVCESARGQGIAEKLCIHSQQVAQQIGYLGMQFNFVVSTNTGAIRLWQKLGFEVVGTLSKAFNHPSHGLVDALVMYKWLN